MPLFKKKQDKDKPVNERKESRRDFRLARIQEITAKAYAVAAKRKWLFFIIASIIVGYIVMSYAGFLPKAGGLIKSLF